MIVPMGSGTTAQRKGLYRLSNLPAFASIPQSLPCPFRMTSVGRPLNGARCFTLRSKRLLRPGHRVSWHRTVVAKAQDTGNSVQNGDERPLTRVSHSSNGEKPKRGRPKGSKNVKKGEKVQPSAKKSTRTVKPRFGNTDSRNGFEFSDEDDDEDDDDDDDDDDGEYNLRAPNGLSSGPRDFLQELLPIMAQQEMQGLQVENEDERMMRGLLSEAMMGLFEKGSESSRLENLRPYKKRAKPVACDACDSTGMVTCSYCKGEGMVDFGEDAHKFHKEFGGTRMQLTKRVMGNVYLCPYCGGLMEERCEKCLGSGDLVDEDQKREPYAAREDYRSKVWTVLNVEKILSEEEGEIEYGEDGLIIARAKTRKGKGGRKPKKRKEQGDTEDEDSSEDASKTEPKQAEPKRKRGRPSKQKPATEIDGQQKGDETLVDDTQSLVTARDSKVRAVVQRKEGPSTDFVNTTDYRVGRRLRKRKTIMSESNVGRSEWSTGEQNNESENEDDQDGSRKIVEG